MNYAARKPLLQRIEGLRGGRKLVCFLNFDRPALPQLPGLSTQFSGDVKEELFRVLKDLPPNSKIDLCLYTRGGDTNAVWPVVNLVREYDPDFEVLIPFRCHSSGTLVALGARKIVMSRLAELSPIDPSTGNQFNPQDPANPSSRLAISVEDVEQYRAFVLNQFSDPISEASTELIAPFLKRLIEQVHPLALGNVHRVHQQIKQLARNLLHYHANADEGLEDIVGSLTTRFYSHLHMIGRGEAQEILGADKVEFAPDELDNALDDLLRAYEDRFGLRKTFVLASELGDDLSKNVRFIGGVIEADSRSYLYETKATIRQHSKLPPNVQVQLPAGQPLPLVPGLPRELDVQITAQGWIHNKAPEGVTT